MTQETDDNGNEEDVCPGCGLPESRWPMEGTISASGELYCCRPCMEGNVCSCAPREESPHVKHGL